MSRLNIFLILVLVFLLAYARLDASTSGVDSQTVSAVPTATATPSPTPTPIPMRPPQMIDIPKISVHAPVVQVGTDGSGKMDMPEDAGGFFEAAWYSQGFKPGEQGNTVIAGHLDQVTGAPALFWNLKLLEPGDEVTVTDDQGKPLTFVVTHKEIYPFDQAPIDTIFGPSQDKNLNLMTCSGTWNPATHNYSDRLVVFTKLKEE